MTKSVIDENVIFEGGRPVRTTWEQEGGGGQKSEIFANVIYEWPLKWVNHLENRNNKLWLKEKFIDPKQCNITTQHLLPSGVVFKYFFKIELQCAPAPKLWPPTDWPPKSWGVDQEGDDCDAASRLLRNPNAGTDGRKLQTEEKWWGQGHR